jgi:hypothetical protein
MRYAVDPRQTFLFDPAGALFSPKVIQRLSRDWPGLFRSQLLQLMPAEALGKQFHETLGCPTKELYGMAGAIFLKEFFNLTIERTVERYLLDAGWQFALNVNPMEVSMGHATVERYTSLFAGNDLARAIFDRVTDTLVKALELDVSKQRLDSTHIFSAMAIFGRTKLMGVSIKRFLVQLKRHHEALYLALPPAVRDRYTPSQARLFGDFKGERATLRQQAAEDLLFLVSRFASETAITSRSSYQAMSRILNEQCDVVAARVTLKDKPGGNVMQNPSEPDATYDGHKGPGYQAQISETCSETNDVQLITNVLCEPAHCSDQGAVGPMLEQLEAHALQPTTLFADTHYGSDANVVLAAQKGVDLQSPVSGKEPSESLTLNDFSIEETTETVLACPNGCVPASSTPDAENGATTTVMNPEGCAACERRSRCPVREVRGEYVLKHTPAQRRLAARRAKQSTDTFRKAYSIRAGIESLNSQLKRKLGMGRLRVRGSPMVSFAVLLRCAGWNLLCALRAMKKRGIRDFSTLVSHFYQVVRSMFFSDERWRGSKAVVSEILRGFIRAKGNFAYPILG